MKNLILCGMMGCGKTTMARMLGQHFGREVVDTDQYIEALAGMTVSDIFAKEGESGFRDRETAACRVLSAERDKIIATGGGLPLREENRKLLRETGIVIFLNRDPAAIYDNVDMSRRPLGQQGKAAFLERFSQREPIYRDFAHIIIENVSSQRETLEEILIKLEGQL